MIPAVGEGLGRAKVTHCENSTHVTRDPCQIPCLQGKLEDYTGTLSLGLGSSLKSAVRTFRSLSQQEKPRTPRR